MHGWEAWVLYVTSSGLLELHVWGGARFSTATSATGCRSGGGWITALRGSHHLGDEWVGLFVAQDPRHLSTVEWMDGLEMDMPEWAEGTKEVPVESVDWARCPTEM